MRKNKSNKPSQLVRLNKFIADCGITSRRKADALIDSGEVKLNGKVVYELGIKIDPKKDHVKINDRPIFMTQQKVYYMFNKPLKVLTSMSDPQERTTVADFFSKAKQRIFPVGRLDWDTEGLLLLTNDGEYSNAIMDPKMEIPKTYVVKLDGKPTQAQLQKLKKGVSIIGGKVKALDVRKIPSKGSTNYDWVKITITEGKNRQVRKMFEKIGYDVKRLQRLSIGKLKIGSLKKGEYVKLTATQALKVFEKPKYPKDTTQSRKN